jgi:hypothetical protein
MKMTRMAIRSALGRARPTFAEYVPVVFWPRWWHRCAMNWRTRSMF